MNHYFEEGESFVWVKDRDFQGDPLQISLKMLKESHRTANKQGMIAEDMHSGKKYFAKVIFCEEMDSIYVEKESKAQLYSPFIIRIYGGMLDARNKRFITLQEYIPGCDLSDLMYQDGIQGETWKEKMKIRHRIALKILYGISYYMSLYKEDPIVHRDLKPENIMVSGDGSLVKIVDFDWVHLHDSSHTVLGRIEQKGTPGYADPKYWNSYICQKEMDIYSAGLVLFFLYTGHHHFYGNEEIQRYMVGDDYAYTLKEMPGIDEELREIIAKMIARDQDRYRDIEDVIRDLTAYLKSRDCYEEPEELLNDEEEDTIRFSYRIGDVIYRPYVKNCRFIPIEFGTKQERSFNGKMSGHILSFYRVGKNIKAIILHEDCHPLLVKSDRKVSEGDIYTYAGTQIEVLQIR